MTRVGRRFWPPGLGLLFLTVFLLAVFPTRGSNDDWWHIKTGWYQVTHRDLLPEYEVFTYTGEDTPWANHEWLSDLLIYLGYSSLGLRGVTIVKAAFVGITFVLLAWFLLRRSGNVAFALLFSLLAAISSRYSMHLRPPIFSYLGVTVLLHLLASVHQRVSRGQSPGKLLVFLFLLSVVWINLHGGGILAIIICGLMTVGHGIEWWWQGKVSGEAGEAEASRRLAAWFAAATGVIFLGTLCNPYGIEVHLLTFRVMGDPILVQLVDELQTPNFHYAKGYEAMIVLLVALAALVQRRVGFPDLLVVLFFLQQSVNHVRHLPLFSIVVAPVLAIMLRDLVMGCFQPRWQRLSQWGALILFGLICAVQIPRGYASNWLHLQMSPEGYERKAYPSDAVDFILSHDFHGRMYNQINYSGYLIYRLSPEHFKIFTDARFDIYGSQFMHQSHAIMDAEIMPDRREIKSASGDWADALTEFNDYARALLLRGEEPHAFWRWLLDRWKVNFLVLHQSARLFAALHNGDPHWEEVYVDNEYAIFVRNVPENAELIRQCLGAR